MALHTWKAEYRETEVNGVNEGAWWLTDGTESFRMFGRLTAEMLASYLNAGKR